MKRSPDRRANNHASPVLAIIALTLTGLLALVVAERYWIDGVSSAGMLVSGLHRGRSPSEP